MQLTGAMKASAVVLQTIFPGLLFLCVAVSGCGTTCVSGVWNGNGSRLAVSNVSCPLNTGTGMVMVQMSAAPAVVPTASATFPPPFPSPRGAQHLYVTLRGIEAHPSLTADADPSGWQELVPELATHPKQLDLLTLDSDSGAMDFPTSANVPAAVPADEYRRLRLRLMPLHASPDEFFPESNSCGSVGWNCVVLADGSVRPLDFDGAAAEFLVSPEHGTERVLRVLPDELIHLSIEFHAASSALFVSNAGVRLIPVFRVVSRTPSPAASAQ